MSENVDGDLGKVPRRKKIILSSATRRIEHCALPTRTLEEAVFLNPSLVSVFLNLMQNVSPSITRSLLARLYSPRT